MKSLASLVVVSALIAVSNVQAGAQWSVRELATLRSLWLAEPAAPPADPSNRFADDPGAARLGKALFFDAQLSSDQKVSCAACHQPDHAFTDQRPVGQGIAVGARRTMPVGVGVHSPWQFWDGRADSLWAQALGPLENPVEHGFSRTELVRAVATRYRADYEATFGPLPDRQAVAGLPPGASPAGDAHAQAEWNSLPRREQAEVNRAFANVGKAIAAYERTMRVQPARFDAYLASLFEPRANTTVLSADEIAGLRLFIGKAQCVTCHNGPLLSNQGFANTGMPARAGFAPDEGRAEGVRQALGDPFNCRGAYSDARPDQCDELDFAVSDGPALVGAFKIPSLRGVAQRPPYMHAGQLASLEAVIGHYDRAPKAPLGSSELHPLRLSAEERRQLVAFLQTLDEKPERTAAHPNG